jgi:hypothetical protein
MSGPGYKRNSGGPVVKSSPLDIEMLLNAQAEQLEFLAQKMKKKKR